MYGAAHNIYYTKRQYLLRLLPLLLLRCLRHPLHFYHSSYYPRHDIRPASSLLVASISSYSSLSTSNPTKGRGRFFMATFLFQPHLQFFFSCKPSFSIFLHFTFQNPPLFLYPSHTVRPPARVIYIPSISLSLSIYLIIFVNIVNALLVNNHTINVRRHVITRGIINT